MCEVTQAQYKNIRRSRLIFLTFRVNFYIQGSSRKTTFTCVCTLSMASETSSFSLTTKSRRKGQRPSISSDWSRKAGGGSSVPWSPGAKAAVWAPWSRGLPCTQPVPWLLYSNTPFLKNGENSHRSRLESRRPPWARRGELEEDSITWTRFLR